MYVDDLRLMAPNKEEAWLAAHVTGAMMAHLGIQGSSHKCRECSKTPGAWAESVVRTHEDGVCVLTSEEKWKNLGKLVKEINQIVENDAGRLCRQRLLEIRGFIQYVCQTYSWLTPYLMGLHLMIDG